MLLRRTVAIAAVTGSCHTSVTPASSTSSSPDRIRTEEMSRIRRLIAPRSLVSWFEISGADLASGWATRTHPPAARTRSPRAAREDISDGTQRRSADLGPPSAPGGGRGRGGGGARRQPAPPPPPTPPPPPPPGAPTGPAPPPGRTPPPPGAPP